MSLSAVRRQRGNMLIGVVIGVVIGLGIAVVVALVINKGGTPFDERTFKLGRPTTLVPAGSADPNKPLYFSREAAVAANRDLADKASKAGANPVAPKLAASAEADAPRESDTMRQEESPAITTKEPVDKRAPPAPATSDVAPVVRQAASDDRYIYYLQAGTFRDEGDAEATRAKLEQLGFEAALSERNVDSGILFRVRVGPYGDAESMKKARGKLISNGIDAAVVRNQL